VIKGFQQPLSLGFNLKACEKAGHVIEYDRSGMIRIPKEEQNAN